MFCIGHSLSLIPWDSLGRSAAENRMKENYLIMNMKQLLKNLMSEDSGQDLIEYTLLAALIALVAIASVGALGKTVNNVFNNVDTSLSNVGH